MLAIADYGLHSAVQTAVACERAGVDHIVGLRVRVVPERAKRTFFLAIFTRTKEDASRSVLRDQELPCWQSAHG